MEVAFRAGEMMDLQPLDLLLDRLACRQQRRHRDERAQMRGHAVAQLQGGQERGAEAPCHARGSPARRPRRWRESHPVAAEQAQPRSMQAHGSEREQRRGKDDRSDNSDRADIAANANRPARSPEPSVRRRPKADLRLERGATSAEKVIARIAPAAFHHARVACGLLRGHDCAVRDLDLGAIRAARQFLDGAAIEIARREIHLGKSAARRRARRRPG